MTIRTYRAVGDGTYCEGRQTVIIGEGQSREQIIDTANRAFFMAYDRTDPANWIGACPFETDEPVPMVTAADVLFVLRDQLPRPEPIIAPGHALAGLEMHLQTGRPLTYSNATSVTVGGITVGLDVDASASFMVDWGDGSDPTGPYDRPGGPWPEGPVTHVYTHVGTYDVTVTDTWTINWRLNGDGWNEPIVAELAPTTLLDFEVRQRQAVRTD